MGDIIIRANSDIDRVEATLKRATLTADQKFSKIKVPALDPYIDKRQLIQGKWVVVENDESLS